MDYCTCTRYGAALIEGHTYKCAPGYYVLQEILRYPRRSRHGTLKAQTCC